jgi:single-strand DNA-binding protein
MNSVQLVGRVGQDPQIFGDGAKRVARISLATTERGFTKKDGTKVEDRTEWHNLVFFGSITQVIEKYVKKGELISVRGSIHYDKYEDKDKVVRYTTDIRCTDLELLGSKKESEQVQQYKSNEEEIPF